MDKKTSRLSFEEAEDDVSLKRSTKTTNEIITESKMDKQTTDQTGMKNR